MRVRAETGAGSGAAVPAPDPDVSAAGSGDSATGAAGRRAEPRAALAAAQAALVSALVAGTEPPPGFDRDRLRVQSRALLAKRSRQAAAHHEWLALALGPADYRTLFAAYAAEHPLHVDAGGSHADATAFERHLRRHGLLPRPRRAPTRRRWWRRG